MLALSDVACQRRELLVADDPGRRAGWHYAEHVDARLSDPDLDVTVEQLSDGCRLTVTADRPRGNACDSA